MEGGLFKGIIRTYVIAPDCLVDEDEVIENSADASRCSFIDMVFTNPTGDCWDKRKPKAFISITEIISFV